MSPRIERRPLFPEEEKLLRYFFKDREELVLAYMSAATKKERGARLRALGVRGKAGSAVACQRVGFILKKIGTMLRVSNGEAEPWFWLEPPLPKNFWRALTVINKFFLSKYWGVSDVRNVVPLNYKWEDSNFQQEFLGTMERFAEEATDGEIVRMRDIGFQSLPWFRKIAITAIVPFRFWYLDFYRDVYPQIIQALSAYSRFRRESS